MAVLSLLAVSTTRAWAANLVTEGECPRVDLDAPFGSLWGIEPGAQGRHGTCYAWAGVHMADAYRQSQCGKIAELDRISVIASSIEKKDAIGDDDLDGGGACAVVKQISQAGFCTEKNLPSIGRNGLRLNRLLVQLSTLRNRVRDGSVSRTEASETIASSLGAYGLVVPSKTVIREGVSGSSETELFAKLLFHPNCAELEHYPFPECRRRKKDSFEAPSRMKAFIDARIVSSNSVPLVINYCSRVLEAHGADASCGPHASLIAGRRWFPTESFSARGERLGRCAYKIHNSWGSDCSKYSRRWACENGSVWVDQDALLDEALGLMVLE